MSVLPLHTARLALRLMRPADAATLAAYRDDRRIARLQAWHLPCRVEQATAMLADQGDVTDLVPGRMLQVAVEHGGVVVGDLAVGPGDDGTTATPGYSLDPGNHASTRVIEPLGFAHGGLARQSVPAVRPGPWRVDRRAAVRTAARRPRGLAGPPPGPAGRGAPRRSVGREPHRLVGIFRSEGHTSILVSWVDRPGGPRGFHEGLGFVPTGRTEDGEVEARLDLGGPGS